ncbi:transporter associated domain-containing protein [Arthrobacter sp. JCM 19049]|uniref:transporter associated domain-containing protein n=1 Tax=Arthrobacter sp. JCM 19049 TaxID=1460643 RepID=UPI0006CF9B4D|nr:transporter associated domain-containing protein [Arthrobacter sp. JCM 19049]
MGDIDDEYDRSRPDVVENPDGTLTAQAGTSIDDVADFFDMDIEEEDVDTVGGLISKALESVPVLGSVAEIHGLRLEVVSLSGRRNRVGKIHVERLHHGASDQRETIEESPNGRD